MSKSSGAKRLAKMKKGSKRAAERYVRQRQDAEAMAKWMKQFPEVIAPAVHMPVPDLLGLIATHLAHEEDPRLEQAVIYLDRYAPETAPACLAKGMWHLQNGHLGSAYVELTRFQSTWPDHRAAASVPVLLERAEKFFEDRGYTPEQAVMWDEIKGHLQKAHVRQAAEAVDRLLEQWPSDKMALEFRETLVTVAKL